MVEGSCPLVRNINLSRTEFGRYFRLIQFAHENKITGYYCYNFFKNILFKIKDKANYSYLQFFVCLQVFKELGIVVTNDTDTEVIKITNVKNSLNASAFYNRLNTLKTGNKN